ncbi:MAG TPA: class I SAM-dependent methyltransferase [Kiritimatiellia bacterium]
MKERVERTHDKALYLAENRYEAPKEYFRVLCDMATAEGHLRPGQRICDIGCAAGEFLHYVSRACPGARLEGYDPVPELLEKARQHVPGAQFKAGSVLDRALLKEGSVDTCFLLGVHSIFDEFETCFGNLLAWTRPGGAVYIFGAFNPYPVDVWVKYRLADGHEAEHREPGWNMFSKVSVARFLDRQGMQGRYSFTPFELPFDLLRNATDLVRTWTMRDCEGRRQFVNGLMLLVNLEILVVRP